MGRRRKGRKIRPRPKRKLPEIFQCPRCGSASVSVSVNKSEGMVKVVCSNCKLSYSFEYNQYLHPVDYYSMFLDKFEEELAGGAAIEGEGIPAGASQE